VRDNLAYLKSAPTFDSNVTISGTLNVSGVTTFGSSIIQPGAGLNIGATGASATSNIRIGGTASGNRFSIIDLQGDSTYADGLRIIRNNTGANTSSSITHRGTGSLILNAVDGGDIHQQVSSADILTLNSTTIGFVVGVLTIPAAGLIIGPTGSGTTSAIRIGGNATGSRTSFIDFQGDATYTDGLRMGRSNTGANTNSFITHRGTGSLVLNAFDSGGTVLIQINSIMQLSTSSTGVTVSALTVSGDATLGNNLSIAGHVTTSLLLSSGTSIGLGGVTPSVSNSIAFGDVDSYGVGNGDGRIDWVCNANGVATMYQNTGAGVKGMYIGGTAAPAYALQVAVDSAAKPNGGSWTNSSSDIRTKTVLGPYEYGLRAILDLNLVRYAYNGRGGTVEGLRGAGFIAQEAQQVIPEMVGTRRAKLDEDDTEETDLLTVNNDPMIYALLNAVKELAQRLERVENR
jgi:hypothetical protein